MPYTRCNFSSITDHLEVAFAVESGRADLAHIVCEYILADVSLREAMWQARALDGLLTPASEAAYHTKLAAFNITAEGRSDLGVDVPEMQG